MVVNEQLAAVLERDTVQVLEDGGFAPAEEAAAEEAPAAEDTDKDAPAKEEAAAKSA